MKLNIRPETPTDYVISAHIHNIAFDYRATEPTIVALLRQRPQFDSALALVAELDHEVVGHAVFSPYTLRLMGEDIQAVNLAPIAVHPDYHGQGVGAALMEAGHKVAQDKGYVLSFLLGHDSYYPRFGYQTHAFGFSSVEVNTRSFSAISLEKRPPTPLDIPHLQDLWEKAEGQVDFGIVPDDSLLSWLSPNSAIQSIVYTQNEEFVGFARYGLSGISYLLADDKAVAETIILDAAEDATEISLPLHPHSKISQALSLQFKCEPIPHCMAYSLAPNPFDTYFAQVQTGQRAAGRVLWSTPFEI